MKHSHASITDEMIITLRCAAISDVVVCRAKLSENESGELAVAAAACYARHISTRAWVFESRPDTYTDEPAPGNWPLDEELWKPTDPRADLILTVAMLFSEIERIDIAEQENKNDA